MVTADENEGSVRDVLVDEEREKSDSFQRRSVAKMFTKPRTVGEKEKEKNKNILQTQNLDPTTILRPTKYSEATLRMHIIFMVS